MTDTHLEGTRRSAEDVTNSEWKVTPGIGPRSRSTFALAVSMVARRPRC